jgi:hypothetical protein
VVCAVAGIPIVVNIPYLPVLWVPDVPVLSCTAVGRAAAVFLTAVDVSGMFAEPRICS